MRTCPICTTKIEKENQEYCLTCSWEFEYYLEELSEEEKDRYLKRLQIFKSIYEKSIDNPNIQYLEKKLQDKEVLFKELEKKYSELKNQTNEKISLKKIFLNNKIIYFGWNLLLPILRYLSLITFTYFLLYFIFIK